MPGFQMGFVKCALNIALKYFGIGMWNAYWGIENSNQATPYSFHDSFKEALKPNFARWVPYQRGLFVLSWSKRKKKKKRHVISTIKCKLLNLQIQNKSRRQMSASPTAFHSHNDVLCCFQSERGLWYRNRAAHCGLATKTAMWAAHCSLCQLHAKWHCNAQISAF